VLVTLQEPINGIGFKHRTAMRPRLDFLAVPIPLWLSVCFALLTIFLVLTVYFIIRYSSQKSASAFLVGSFLWLGFLYILAENAFFLNTLAKPPRFFVAVVPPFLGIFWMFTQANGKRLVGELSLRQLTWIHTVRIGVEFLLWQLFVVKQIPQMMTFEGHNWDILAGLTAPLMGVMVFQRQRWSPKILLWWNIASLILLVNIVVTAVLSAPLPFQLLNFEQPNVGVFKPTFIWLPGFVVPVVLFSHLVAIKRLWKSQHI
jgi:hypothetical protein